MAASLAAVGYAALRPAGAQGALFRAPTPFRAARSSSGGNCNATPRNAARIHARRGIVCAAATTAPEPGFVREQRHTLPDGVGLELLHLPAAAASASPRPPLLFVHGSYHGAWCWRERWMPYFAAAGYECYAVSLRGQGGSDRKTPAGEPLKVSGDLDSLTDDLASVVAALPSPPVLVAHSFGALLAEKFVSEYGRPGRPALAGVACVCGVPPTGNKQIVMRVLKDSLWKAWKITWAFVGKSFARSLDEARFTFFSEDLPKGDLIRYQQQLADCSPVRLLDLAALNKVLPLPALPPAARGLPAFVGGGSTDLVVDWQAVQETAAWFGVQPTKWEDMAHDCMLDTRWEQAAASLRKWLDGI
ncbi:hypothetical protein ABPG77_009076 [Micractinium sp. CCAP 211/92]